MSCTIVIGAKLELALALAKSSHLDSRYACAQPGWRRLSLGALAMREREIAEAALRRTNWKIYGTNGAAALLRIKPTTLVSK